MRCVRPVIAADPFVFGRRRERSGGGEQAPLSAGDLRLFLTSFFAGFAFIAMFIA